MDIIRRIGGLNINLGKKEEIRFEKQALSTFVRDIKKKEIDRVWIKPKKDLVYYTEKNQDGIIEYTDFYNTDTIWNIIIDSDTELIVDNEPYSTFGISDVFTCLFGVVLMGSIIRTILGNQTPPMMSNAKRPIIEKDIATRFEDVQGIDEAKEELEEIVDFLKNPEKYFKSGAKVPKGALLIGSPGTGKTLLARAIAGESSVPFIQCSGSSFIEMFVGVGAKRVRDIFNEARKNEPCIIFIDEIDAIGKKRSVGGIPSNDEREQTINQLLTEMDGFDTNIHIVVIAATNRVDILDDALLRPGRFDRKINVKLPDIKGRQEILRIHSKNKRFDKSVCFKDIAKQTTGFSGADLENMMNECAIRAIRDNNEGIITPNVVEDTYQRIVVGLKGSGLVSQETKRRIAIHEAGHAIVGALISDKDTVRKISIIPRGNTGGTTFFQSIDDDLRMDTKQNLMGRIKVALGGHAAEEIMYGKENVSLGASNDFEQVFMIVDAMITRYGFSDTVGKIGVVKTENISPLTQYEIDMERKMITDKCYQETIQLLRSRLIELNALTDRLMIEEVVDGKSVYSLLQIDKK